MKNTKRHEAGFIFTKINIMSNHDKKKTYPVDKKAQFISLQNKCVAGREPITRKLILDTLIWITQGMLEEELFHLSDGHSTLTYDLNYDAGLHYNFACWFNFVDC